MNNRSGFTLLELMIVIAIIGLLAAIATPNYIRYRNTRQVTLSARNIYDALQMAKTTAIQDNTRVNVLFSPGVGNNGTYQVFEDVNSDNAFNAGDVYIERGNMEPGVNMVSAVFFGVPHSTRFTSVGLTTGENGTVTVTNGNHTVKVVVNSVGGIRMD